MTENDLKRFWKKVRKKDGCWEWVGCKYWNGYGRILWRGSIMYAHRVSYEIHKGIIPKGLLACHKCDNPNCVNPDHIFLGTNKENIHDAKKKGRLAFGERHGHAKLTPEKVVEIRSIHSKGGTTQQEIADMFGVTLGCIQGVIRRLRWNHIA